MHKIYYQGAFHHVYNRGVRKQEIFKDSQDYDYFLRRLRFYKNKYKIAILAYCLMPNHFHLETKQLGDKPLWRMMQYLGNGYTQYFNRKYQTSGYLFEGRFQAILIEDEFYLTYLSLYIHVNPVDLGYNFENLHEYPWSSYPEYIGVRKGSLPAQYYLFKEFEEKHFKSQQDLKCFHRKYRQFIEAGIPDRLAKNLEKYFIKEE